MFDRQEIAYTFIVNSIASLSGRVMRNWIAFGLLIFVTAAAVNQSPGQQQVATRNDVFTPKTSEARAVVAQAKATALEIKNDFQRGLALDEIGAAEAKVGDLDAAVKTASQAYPHTMATLTQIGEQLGDANDGSKTQSIVAKLSGGGASTVFAFISRRQAEKGNIEEALRTTAQIQAPEVRSDALEWIAQQQAAGGDYSAARKTLARARSANPTDHLTADEVEVMVVAAQLSRGDTRAARATIASLKSAESRSIAMLSGAEELLKKADKTNATAWLEDALKQIPAGAAFDFSRYLAIPYQVRLGQKERAMQAAGRLQSELRVKGYNAVAVTCAEMKDVACVNAALEKMQSVASVGGEAEEPSDFEAKLMILNVTAALIDNGQFDAAVRLLATVEQHSDDVSFKSGIEPEAQLQRVFILVQQDRFDDARSLALKMRPDSVSDIQRGSALRLTSLFQTRKNGVLAAQPWASPLADAEDRAYALLGIAQALLEIGEAKLPYSAIQIH